MSLNVEIKGKAADRFRAYKAVKLLRRPSAADQHARGVAGEDPYPAGTKIRYDGHDVAIEGDVDGDGVGINAGKDTITHVVFYKGPLESEVVVGSIDNVNASGTIEIDFVEPPAEPSAEALIVDEA